MDRGRDPNVSKWKKVYCPTGEWVLYKPQHFDSVSEQPFSDKSFVSVLDGADGMKSTNRDNSNVVGHCPTSKIVLE